MSRPHRLTAAPGPVTIIGIDCATDPARTGIAVGEWRGGAVRLREAALGTRAIPTHERLRSHLAGVAPVLLALDAPLGWPVPLGRALAAHRAGEPLPLERNALFRRRTDEAIRARVGKRPLDVGADRIARTAHAALGLLEALRRASGEAIPLAWHPSLPGRIAAIEVYPAATLRAHGVPVLAYRRPAARAARRRMVNALTSRLTLGRALEPVLDSADVLDAALCALAGADFLAGRAAPPADEAAARREGWIWARATDATRPPRTA